MYLDYFYLQNNKLLTMTAVTYNVQYSTNNYRSQLSEFVLLS